jgi:hypothetical protein
MPSRRKKAKAASFNAADMANIAKANPYIQRLFDDANLRDNVHKAIESTKRAYGRVSNGKAPAKALFEDKKLQSDLRDALDAMREASMALAEAPKQRARKSRRLGRKIVILGLGGGLALIGSEKLRSKVLDTLFGKEEEFQYTPPAGATPTPPATPVTAA